MAPQLVKIVQEAVRQQAETGYPQAIILSGMIWIIDYSSS